MARRAQISTHQLYSDRFHQLFRGVFIARDEPLNVAAWVDAAKLVLPADAAVTGVTALQLRGLDIGQPLPLRFVIGRDVRCRRVGITLMRRSDVRSIGGAVCNGDAVADACVSSNLLDAVCVVDRALHLKLITDRDLQALRQHPGLAVRRACALARSGAESVRETRLRLCLVLAGLPEPRLQAELRDEGEWLGRYDMLIESHRLLIEYEGDQHRTDKRQWTRDIVRMERAQRLGYGVVRVTADLMRDPWTQVLRVHDELARRGYSGDAPARSVRWEESFGVLRAASVM